MNILLKNNVRSMFENCYLVSFTIGSISNRISNIIIIIIIITIINLNLQNIIIIIT